MEIGDIVEFEYYDGSQIEGEVYEINGNEVLVQSSKYKYPVNKTICKIKTKYNEREIIFI